TTSDVWRSGVKPGASRLLFFDRTIGRRLYLIVLIMVLGMLGILAIAVRQARDLLFAAQGMETRHLVETAHSLVADFQRRAAQCEMPVQAAQQEALARLSRLRYEKDRYFWVNDMAGLMLMHSTSPQLAGTNVLDTRDAAGARPFKDMIDIVARQDAGLYLYYWPPDATAIDGKDRSGIHLSGPKRCSDEAGHLCTMPFGVILAMTSPIPTMAGLSSSTSIEVNGSGGGKPSCRWRPESA
ncbi:MAG: cache domain-containing protein, partial [Acetobacteraceae bacterium]